MSLPIGYKRLEYIQSTGTQYVDTGFKPTVNTKFSFGVYMLEQTGDCIIGNFLHDYNDYRIFNYSGSIYWDFKDSRIIGTAGSFPKNTYFEFECGNNYVKKNGQQVLTGQNISAFTADANIFVFSNGASARCSGRLYFLKIFDGESLIRDFIPCQKSDGTVGLWDDVNSVFYGNAGTGTFTAGPIIAIAADKSEITKLEYIQSSGTQYIDTGFKPKNTTHVICDFQFENTAKTQYLFCARGPSSGYANRYGLLLNSAGYFRSDYGSANKNFPTTVALGGRHTVDKNGLSCTIDDTTVTNTAKTFTGSYNLYLFAGNTGGSMREPASVKIYSCQIYDNDVLVRDFIAAKLSDGTVGLYDKLSGLLYINAGTGTFEAGASSLNLPVNIGGTWKDANEAFVNIGGTWKTVKDAFVNIGGTWKELG